MQDLEVALKIIMNQFDVQYNSPTQLGKPSLPNIERNHIF